MTQSTPEIRTHQRLSGLAIGQAVVRFAAQYWLATAIVVAFLGVWEAYTRLLDVPRYVLPSVSSIFDAMNFDRDNLAQQFLVTLQEVALGLGLGIAAGLVLAIGMAHARVLERGLYPLVIASQAVPVPAIASPLVIALGYNIWPKVVVVVLCVFFPIVVNVFAGLTSVDAELITLMRSMAASRWQIFWHVRVPAALPLFFAGAKIAATYSVIGAVFGEWVGSDQGLGAYIQQQNATLRMDRAFAAIFILSAMGMLLFMITGIVERFCTPWRHRATK